MNKSEERLRAIAAEEAADWFAANREGLDAEQRRMFLRWLSTSRVHVEEYLGIARLASDLGKAAGELQLLPDALLEEARAANEPDLQPLRPRSPTLPGYPRRPLWAYAAAAAAIAVVAFTLLWPGATRVTPNSGEANVEHFSTAHGEQLNRWLPDGTVLHLNTDSSVTARYGRNERRVLLERGEVVFQVAHDPQRPFRVLAGSAEVVAVGTEFDVYLQHDATLVTVVEGRVTVAATRQPGGTNAPRPVEVSAGEMTRVVAGQPPSAPSPVDIHRVTAWQHRQISFEGAPLADVAAEFNRYSTVPIEIDTPELGGLAISGAFSVDDTESFVAFLRSLNGVSVEVTATRIRVFKN